MLFIAFTCSLLLVLVFGSCFHCLFVAFRCSSLIFLVFEIESVLSQKPKQANAFSCSSWLFVARFGFSGCFHLKIPSLVLVFRWYESPKRATKGKKKFQMETRLNSSKILYQYSTRCRSSI